jgi:hypothetical protein
MTLSNLSLLLGGLVAAVQIYGLLKPAQLGAAARAFPRSLTAGYVLMAIGTLWFLYYLRLESIADFERYKNVMFLGFGLVAAGTAVFVRDFIAVRGLAIVFLVLGKFIVDTARWHDSPWRLVLVTWAYLLIIAGMWFTVSPWRCRDLISWATASEGRIKLLCAVRLAFAILLIVLGLTVFRSNA